MNRITMKALLLLTLFCITVTSTAATGESTPVYAHFANWGLSFDYPREWEASSANELAQLKDYLATQLRSEDIELLDLACFWGPNTETLLSISKYQIPTEKKPSEIIQERNDVYADAMRAGDVTKVNYVRETIVADFPAVEEDIERSNGGRGLTLKIINGLTIFEITFVVTDAAKFPQYSSSFSHLVSTINLVIQ